MMMMKLRPVDPLNFSRTAKKKKKIVIGEITNMQL